jgi:hypothetical protein
MINMQLLMNKNKRYVKILLGYSAVLGAGLSEHMTIMRNKGKLAPVHEDFYPH